MTTGVQFCSGDRVIIAKQRATVRYVGPVDGHEGLWVGVEWDDPSRGKHDGATGGRRYFTCCSAAPTAASFVRINKVTAGTSLMDALVMRYTNQLAEGQGSTADAAQQAYVSTASNKKLWVQLVGQDKVTERQSKLELLTSARLVGANVSTVGPEGKLAATAPSLRQLDLTDNLIGSWSSAASICQQLPGLQSLNLSLNRLQLPSSMPDAGLMQLPGLQCLVLNRCSITWQQVAVLQSSLPQLQELHVAGNAISSLHVQLEQQQQQQQDQTHLVGFSSLQVLGLEDNAISSWQEVLRLAGLPSLQRLALSGNPLSKITYPAGATISTAALFSSTAPGAAGPSAQPGHTAAAAGTRSSGPRDSEQQQEQQQQQPTAQPPFARLQALLLGDCRISSWADVDQLNRYPALCELRLTGNPLFGSEAAAGGGAADAAAAGGDAGSGAGGSGGIAGAAGGDGAGADRPPTASVFASGGGRRFEVIGRVAGLALLNGAAVNPRERRDCELRYLQTVLAEQAEAAAAAAAAGPAVDKQLQQQQHPRLTELQAKYGQVSAFASANPIKQQGSSLSSSTCELLLHCGEAAVKKKLPKSVTVGALRLLCGRLFKLPPDQLQLLLLAPQEGAGQPAAPPSSSQAAPAAAAAAAGEDISLDDTKQLSYWDATDGCVLQVLHVDPDQQRLQREAEELARKQEHEQRMARQLQQGEALRTAAELSLANNPCCG